MKGLVSQQDVKLHIGCLLLLMLFCFYTDTVNSSVYWIYGDNDNRIWENITWRKILQDIGKRGRTLVCKNTLIEYSITCAIFIVSVRPRLLFDLLKKNGWVCNDGETNQSWEKSVCIYKKSSDILSETKDSLHFTIYDPYVQQQKKKRKFFVFIDWYLWHKQSPLSATQCSCSLILVLSPHRSVLYVRSKARSAPG